MADAQRAEHASSRIRPVTGFIYVVPSVGRDYLQPSPQQVPTWLEGAIYFGPCKIPMRPRMQPGDYIFGISPANGSPRRIIFTARIQSKLTFAQAFDQLPKLRGPNGPIHVRPTRSPGLGFPDSHYEHIPKANHSDSWRNDLRTPDLDAFFVCERASGVLGTWLGASGPVLDQSILRFLQNCHVYGASGQPLGKNSFAKYSAPVAHGRLYRGLHLETENPEGFLRHVEMSAKGFEEAGHVRDAGPVPAIGRTRGHRSYSGCIPKSAPSRSILFVRVGADQTPGGGRWNGPIDSDTNAFVYVPIPETKPLREGLGTPYAALSPALLAFGVTLPTHLTGCYMHLDPDFQFSTYGDRGSKGVQLSSRLRAADLLVFYSGLRSVTQGSRLVYAIIGVLSVKSVIGAVQRPAALWHANAHTRRDLTANSDDVVVVGDPSKSGRLQRAIPIGEFRAGSYRVTQSLLAAWGGISAKNGFLQRSAVFPHASDPVKFLQWWEEQAPKLLNINNAVACHLGHVQLVEST